ncbi:hypothetical protein D9M71_279850 [compost metagenome]
MQVFVWHIDETQQQATPRFADGHQARSDYPLRGDPGQLFHGFVPHQDFLVLGQGADAHGQFLQCLAVVAAQRVELGGQAGQAGVVVFQATFDEMNVFGNVVITAGFVRQEGFDHVLGHAWAHQAGQVGFDAVAQAPQGIRATLVERQVEVAQGLFDFLLCGLGAQRLGQLRGEFLGRGRMQFAPLWPANVIDGAGFGGAFFFAAGIGEQRDQGEHQYVDGKRGDSRHVPTGVVEHVDHVQQGNVEALQVAHQRQQHGHHPHDDPCQQTGDETAPVGSWPIQYRQHPRQELQGRDKGDDTQVGQVLRETEQQIETIAGHDDGDDQGAAGPLQPAVDIAFGRGLVQRQHQVVERHAGQCKGRDDDQSAGGGQAADIGQQCQ